MVRAADTSVFAAVCDRSRPFAGDAPRLSLPQTTDAQIHVGPREKIDEAWVSSIQRRGSSVLAARWPKPRKPKALELIRFRGACTAAWAKPLTPTWAAAHMRC